MSRAVGYSALRQVSTLPHPEPGDEHFLLIKAVRDLKMESRIRSQNMGIKTRNHYTGKIIAWQVKNDASFLWKMHKKCTRDSTEKALAKRAQIR